MTARPYDRPPGNSVRAKGRPIEVTADKPGREVFVTVGDVGGGSHLIALDLTRGDGPTAGIRGRGSLRPRRER
jgi:hypothetical protein